MIELEFYVALPPEKAWDYLTLDNHIQKWWGKGVTLERVKGGRFTEPWKDDNGNPHVTLGNVTALENGKRLQMDWQNSDWIKPTRVEFLLLPSTQGTKVCLQHSGWDVFDSKLRKAEVDSHTAGWQELMEKYRRYCAEA